jgi:hypothetical protein
MKKYFYLAALGVAIIITSCSKEKKSDPGANVPVEGYWFGSYKVNGSSPKNNTAILVRPGGTMRYYELMNKTDTFMVIDGMKLDGTWSFSDNVFQFKLFIGSDSATALLARSADFTELNGSYNANGVVYGIMEYKKQ